MKSGVVRVGLRGVAVPVCHPWLLELDWVFLSQGLGKGNRNFLCGSCMFTPELGPFPHRKHRVGLTEIFHDLMMSLKCSIKIFLKIITNGKHPFYWFLSLFLQSRIHYVLYLGRWGLSSRVPEPCARLSEACAVPFWLLGASCWG